MSSRQRLVRISLLLNSAVSLLIGVDLIVFAGPLSHLFGVSDPRVLATLGVGLLPFGAFVYWASRSPEHRAGWIAVASALDATWVVATIALAVFWPETLNRTGWIAAAIVGASVEGLMIGQLLGLRRLVQNTDPQSADEGRSVLEAERIVAAPVETAWAIVSDVHNYADYAPSLQFSRVLRGEGLTTVRECGDDAGRWTERATRWEEGRGYAFAVATDAPDYPYPFRRLGGQWDVEPAAQGTRVRLRFDATMKGGVVGEIALAVLMLPRFSAAIDALLDNWERAMVESPS